MYLQLKNTKLYYEIEGEGHPILMLHGFSLDHHAMVGAFEPIFQQRPGWKRIYLDLPGMGNSPASEGVTNSDQMLDLLVEFSEKLLANERFSMVGFSYGAYMARGLLKRRFDCVSGLMLFAPTMTPNRPKRDLPEQFILVKNPAVMEMIEPAFRPTVESIMVLQEEKILHRVRDEISVGMRKADMGFLRQLQKEYAYSFEVDNLERCFEQPALIITGRHDNGVGYREAGELVPKYPRATYVVLDRAGHSLHLEQVTLFNQLSLEWLDRVEEMLEMV